MERRDVLKAFAGGLATVGLTNLSSASNVARADIVTREPALNEQHEDNVMKKYDNDYFYKDGVFQEDRAFEAYYEMFARLNYSLADSLRANKDFWVADFGLGDFANVGMGGIFFFNDKEFRYFGHDIYLLPGQMIPEHRHEAAEGLPAKHESWQVRYGSIYNFSEGGEKTPQALALIPKSQQEANAISCYNYKYLTVGQQDRLGKIAAPHFMIAGSEGAIVTEYACYHSMDGLKFTNPKAHP
ncbi:MAG: hypothetical protein Q4G03_02580 [Planctomycetia bacterium]|nr:hypothetical protein [Planctomycetia bacterium]